MTYCLSSKLDEIKEIQLSKENVQGFGIQEYSLSVKKGIEAPYWSYKSKRKLKPEAVISMLLEEHDFVVMDREGELIRGFYNLLCLMAYEEHENGPMITETARGKKIVVRPCFVTFPSAPFTLEYIKKLLTNSSVDEIIEYLEIFGQKKPYGYDEKELDIIHAFLTAFTLQRLLAMFELALSSSSETSGWPDITAIKDNCVYFIEVKTTDSLTKRQKDWLTIYKDSLGLNYRIVRLVQN